MRRRLPIWGIIFAAVFGLSQFGVVGPFDALLLILGLPVALDLIISILRRLSRSRSAGPFPFPYFILAPWAVRIIWLMVALKIAWASFYSPERFVSSQSAEQQDLLSRKDYLIRRIASPEFGPESSPLFLTPEFKEEWAIGTISMTGLALAQLTVSHPELRTAHSEILDRLIQRMLKPDIRIYEQRYWNEDALDSLSGINGHVGYLGHLNLLFGLFRLLGGDSKYDALHLDVSNALARRILAGAHPFLETFPGQIFIPDNSVVISSLALHNRIRQNEHYEKAIHAWLTYTKTTLLDPETGLIAPLVDKNGHPIGRPRGSYAAWNVLYLLQADPQFARDQAQRIRDSLLAHLPFGACGIREYLPGLSGPGDIDSGPVIFGLSTSGTGFGLAAAKVLNDSDMTRCLLLAAELGGSTVSSKNGRRYLLAPLIGDAILLAMRTAESL